MSLMDQFHKVASGEEIVESKKEAEKGDVLNGHTADEINGPIAEGKNAKGENNNNGVSHNAAGENKTAYSLMNELEKIAYPEEGRIERGLAADALLGAGIGGHYAKKHNVLGVKEDDSHAAANAKLGALGAGTAGAVGGALVGSSMGGRLGALGGAATVGTIYGGLGAAGGALNGVLHDKYDEHLRGKQMEQTASEGLMDSFEKIAYPEEGRIERGLAADALLGAGIGGHYAKKHNVLGINKDDSHTAANAKLGAMGGAVGGAGYGGLVGGLMAGKKGAALGATAGGALYSGLGAASGAVNGMMHDNYDQHLRRKEQMEQTASSNLMSELEKIAQDAYPEEGRINRGFLAETFLGSGPVGYWAKENNKLGVKEDDNHMIANAKMGILNSGTLGLVGGGLAGATSAADKFNSGRGALLGAAGGGLLGAGYGAVSGVVNGGVIGAGHDIYDDHLRNKQARQKQMEQTASEDLMQDLEKVAANWIKGIKDTATALPGKVKNTFSEATAKPKPNSNELALNNANETRDAARKKIAIGAGVAAGTAATGAAIGTTVKNNQEKTAAEDSMNDLYKEAAANILDMHTPEVKAYEDPINRIHFRR